MRKMFFYRKNSTKGVLVNSKQDILACMGDLGYSIDSIVVHDSLVIGYIGGQGVTLGHLIEE